MFEKSASKLKLEPKNIVDIVTFKIWTLNTVNQLHRHNIDVIYIQEHRYYLCQLEIKYHDTSTGWTFFLTSAWKNSINAIIDGVGMLLSPHALKSQKQHRENPTFLLFQLIAVLIFYWEQHHSDLTWNKHERLSV